MTNKLQNFVSCCNYSAQECVKKYILIFSPNCNSSRPILQPCDQILNCNWIQHKTENIIKQTCQSFSLYKQSIKYHLFYVWKMYTEQNIKQYISYFCNRDRSCPPFLICPCDPPSSFGHFICIKILYSCTPPPHVKPDSTPLQHISQNFVYGFNFVIRYKIYFNKKF